jgi:hypothetical protein
MNRWLPLYACGAIIVILAIGFGFHKKPVPPIAVMPTATSTQDIPATSTVAQSHTVTVPKPAQSKPSIPAPQPNPQPTPQPPAHSDQVVCNTSLIKPNGYDSFFVISKSACDLVNQLYAQGKAAGNVGDTYENRDALHVNFCDGWYPVPECPIANRLFPQHSWKLGGSTGKATTVTPGITIGQASYAGFTEGDAKYGIPHLFYESQTGADELYQQYTHNNLYIYPSLDDDTDEARANIANTPYTIGSKQISMAGSDYYHVHAASGSEFPFVKLALLGLASLKPDVKSALAGTRLLMPTLQILLRESYQGPNPHTSSFQAHALIDGLPSPLYDPVKLVRTANALTLADVPPLVQMQVMNETFGADERYFDTPGAIARHMVPGTTRKITVSALKSFDYDGKTTDHVFEWRILEGDPSRVKIAVNQANPAEAIIEFTAGDHTERMDVGVFVKKTGSGHLSVPGIISSYVSR